MKKKKAEAPSFCEFKPAEANKEMPNISAFYKHKKDCSWQGIRDEPYKPEGDDWAKIIRRVLIGGRSETAKFHVRYFEISSGGNSSLEKHRHEHVVICLRGKGEVCYGKTKKVMAYLDTVYIAPDTPHRLSNPFEEPFGFLCIVNAKRDRPILLK